MYLLRECQRNTCINVYSCIKQGIIYVYIYIHTYWLITILVINKTIILPLLFSLLGVNSWWSLLGVGPHTCTVNRHVRVCGDFQVTGYARTAVVSFNGQGGYHYSEGINSNKSAKSYINLIFRNQVVFFCFTTKTTWLLGLESERQYDSNNINKSSMSSNWLIFLFFTRMSKEYLHKCLFLH